MKRKSLLWLVPVLISFMWIMHTLTKNFMTDPELLKFLAQKAKPIADRSLWLLMIRVHIILAVISLVTGPIGAVRRIRAKSVSLHRWNGRIYLLSILLNFIPGLYVAFFASGGWMSVCGFVILNVLWLGTTWLGYIHIRRKDAASHMKWMTRSFFLTYANLTIHIVLAVSSHGLKLPYDVSYVVAVWSSFLINLLLAELAIRNKWIG